MVADRRGARRALLHLERDGLSAVWASEGAHGALLNPTLASMSLVPPEGYRGVMTEQSPAITISHPNPTLTRLFNPVLTLLLRTPLLGGARNQFMTVSFTGRKTGKHFSVPLSAHQVDGVLYSLSGGNAKWKYNFRDGHDAQVLFDGKTTAMRGELIDDTGLIASLYTRLAASYGAKRGGRSFGLAFRNNEVPTLDDFVEAVERLPLRAIRFTPAT
jgi:hypothetical protein